METDGKYSIPFTFFFNTIIACTCSLILHDILTGRPAPDYAVDGRRWGGFKWKTLGLHAILVSGVGVLILVLVSVLISKCGNCFNGVGRQQKSRRKDMKGIINTTGNMTGIANGAIIVGNISVIVIQPKQREKKLSQKKVSK